MVTNKPVGQKRGIEGGIHAHDLHHEHPHPPRQAEAHRRQSPSLATNELDE